MADIRARRSNGKGSHSTLVEFLPELYTGETIQCVSRSLTFLRSVSLSLSLCRRSSLSLSVFLSVSFTLYCSPRSLFFQLFGSLHGKASVPHTTHLYSHRNIACAKCKRLHGGAQARPTSVGFIRTVLQALTFLPRLMSRSQRQLHIDQSADWTVCAHTSVALGSSRKNSSLSLSL